MGPRVGFVGLGVMGEGMASNLVRAGYQVTVLDLRPDIVERLRALGAQPARSSFEVGSKAAMAFVAVFSDQQVLDVCLGSDGDQGLISAMPADSVVVIHSSVERSTLQELANEAAPRSIDIVDAAMTGGGRVAADAGTLTFYVGGSHRAVSRVRPALEIMASHVYETGELGSGSVVKLISNFLAISNTNLVREALGLGRAFGLRDLELLNLLNTGEVGASWVTNHWGAIRAQEQSYDTPSAMADLARKDLAAVASLATDKGVQLSILDYIVEHVAPHLQKLSDVDEDPGIPEPLGDPTRTEA